MSNEVVQFIHRLLAAWKNGEIERFADFYAADYVGSDVAEAGEIKGIPAIQQHAARYFRAFPDIQIENQDMVVQGNQVALVWKAHGTHRGPFLHIPATGRKVTVDGMALLTLRDGVICRSKVIWDVAGMLRAINLLPEL